MVKIKFDEEKCLKPEECMECIRACPLGVLMLAPKKKPPNPGIPPPRYIVYPLYDVVCNRCGKCLEVCPKGALKLI